MLTEFHGIADSNGLLDLRQFSSTHVYDSQRRKPSRLHFWAVIEDYRIPEIITELEGGRRKRALELLEAHAISMGTKAEGY